VNRRKLALSDRVAMRRNRLPVLKTQSGFVNRLT